MNGETWAALQELGVDESTELRLDLSSGWVSWGNPFLDGNRRAYAFDLPRQRQSTWRVPWIGPRGRPQVSAVHTRREILIAATLKANDEGDPLTVRVYRARLPTR